MNTNWAYCALCIVLAMAANHPAEASSINLGNTTIDFVQVGNPGNLPQWSHSSVGDRLCGAVSYTYSIGKYEISASQYTEFLNSVAGIDTYGLYSEEMITSQYGCQIERQGNGTVTNPYTYSVAPSNSNLPVNFVSWGDAARFTNWLTNGQPTGLQDIHTTESGSYLLLGAVTDNSLYTVNRIQESDMISSKVYYFLPSEDEWHKAAYHMNDGPSGNYFLYPTSSNDLPGQDTTELTNPGNNANYRLTSDDSIPYFTTAIGEFELSVSPYGTFDQGGNLWEWNEAMNAIYAQRGIRGGSFITPIDGIDNDLQGIERSFTYPSGDYSHVGFRIVAIPEPASICYMISSAACLLFRHRKKLL